MPNIIVPNEALLNWANAQLLDLPTLTDCRLRLISELMDIDSETTSAELVAAESGFLGYEPKTMEEWSEPVIIDGEAITEPDVISFINESGATQHVYGMFVTSLSSNKLWFASRFGTGVTLADGTELQVDASFNLRSLFSTGE